MRNQAPPTVLVLQAFGYFGCEPGHWLSQDDLDGFAEDHDLAQKELRRASRRAVHLGWIVPVYRGCFRLSPLGARQQRPRTSSRSGWAAQLAGPGGSWWRDRCR